MSTIPRFKNNAPDIKSTLTKISLKMSNQNIQKVGQDSFFITLKRIIIIMFFYLKLSLFL